MHAAVVVYSRSGNSLKVAKALAATLGAEVVEIDCGRSYAGAIGFVRGIVDSLRRRKPPIELSRNLAKQHDLVVIAGPIWAGRPAAPLMSFLASRPQLPARVALVLTHGGSKADKAFAEIEAMVGRPPAARVALKEADIRRDRFSAALADFARRATGEVESHLIGHMATRAA